MATLDYSIQGRRPVVEEGDNALVTWTPLLTSSTPSAVSTFRDFTDRTIQVYGTFGGASLELHGSLEGTQYQPLTDAQGVVISFSSAGIKTIMEATPYLKPVLVGGDVTTSLTVGVYVRRST